MSGSLLALMRSKEDEKKALEEAEEEAKRPAIVHPATAYASDPYGFIKDVFGVSCYEKQIQICRDIADNTEVSVTSGNGVGKSFLFPLLAWWWVSTRDNALVIITSSVDRQVRAIHWRALNEWWNRCPYYLGPKPSLDPQTGWKSEDLSRMIMGYTAKRKEDVQGTRFQNTLILVDESSGIPNDVSDGFGTLLTGGGKRFNCGNPTKQEGWFRDIFRKKLGVTHSISCLETPNVLTGEMIVPGLVSRDWVERKKAQWGEGDPRYKIHVLGEFIEIEDARVIPEGMIQDSVGPTHSIDDSRLRLGLDIAQAGDDETALAYMRGNVYRIETRSGLNLDQIAEWVLGEVGDDTSALIQFDATGMGFAMHRLLEKAPCEVRGIHFGQRSHSVNEYANVRDELPFTLRDFMKSGGRILENEELKEEMRSVEFRFDNRYRMRVSGKDMLRKKLGRSPDKLDAVCLAVYGFENDLRVSKKEDTQEVYAPKVSMQKSSFRWR